MLPLMFISLCLYFNLFPLCHRAAVDGKLRICHTGFAKQVAFAVVSLHFSHDKTVEHKGVKSHILYVFGGWADRNYPCFVCLLF